MKALFVVGLLIGWAFMGNPAVAASVRCSLFANSNNQLVLDFPGARLQADLSNLEEVQKLTSIAKNLAQAGFCSF
jgi:hypothetical protein